MLNSFKYKNGVGWLAFLFVVLHFGFIFGYAWPTELTNSKIPSITKSYVEPIFTQKWAMFAPCPTVNANITVKFYFESDSTEWFDPVASAKLQHRRYRATHHGELVLAASNLAYWLTLDLDYFQIDPSKPFPEEKIAPFFEGYSYFKIKNYLLGNAIYHYNERPEKARICFELTDVVEQKTETLELPIFEY